MLLRIELGMKEPQELPSQRNAQMVNGKSGHFHSFSTQVNNRYDVVQTTNSEEIMNMAILTNQSVIPIPEEGIASAARHLKEGRSSILQQQDQFLQIGKQSMDYCRRKEEEPVRQHVQDIPDAISRAPICNGIKRLLQRFHSIRPVKAGRIP